MREISVRLRWGARWIKRLIIKMLIGSKDLERLDKWKRSERVKRSLLTSALGLKEVQNELVRRTIKFNQLMK